MTAFAGSKNLAFATSAYRTTFKGNNVLMFGRKNIKRIKFSVIFCLIVLIISAPNTQAQDNKIKLSLRNGILVAAANMYPNHTGCRATTYAGTVSGLQVSGASVSLIVHTKKGDKDLSFQTATKAEMDLILPFIQKKGRTVRFGIYECGSGGIPQVDNIK